ncbi:MAG: AAA family ATPase [bacterium]
MTRDDQTTDRDPTLPPEPGARAAGLSEDGPSGLGRAEGFTIPVSAFDLHRVAGSGGEGEVWLGKHREQGLLVAVKVMKARYARDEVYRARFNEEVRAAAALSHHGIVSILDYGTIDDRAAEQSGGRLVTGCPYLVMERAEGGALSEVLPLHSFSELRSVLTDLLDALAHAHARGVIHRDIKPGNILLRHRNREQPGLLLADFGIAFASVSHATPATTRSRSRMRLWREAEDHVQTETGTHPASQAHGVAAGTPPYMAPEQIHGDLNNQGPWTDLYAVGCLAYKLACGHTPFHAAGHDNQSVFTAHLHAVVPAPKLRFPAPAGFFRWLLRLLAKAPWERFQRAADAAYGLLALGDAPHVTERITDPGPHHPDPCTETNIDTAPPHDEALPTRTVRVTPPSGAKPPADVVSRSAEREEDAPSQPETDSAGPDLRLGTAPFPQRWQGAQPPPRPARLAGAGLDLFGLRAIPFVGRDDERNLLWSSLGQVHRDQRPLLVAIHGVAGVGKSRLAQWLAQRADELGWAEVMQASHGAFANTADGIPSLLVRTLRCQGLSSDEMRQQTRHVLRGLPRSDRDDTDTADIEYLSLALTQLMEPQARAGEKGGSRRGDGVFAGQEARWAVIRQLLRRKARQRPVILWLDDVQWGMDALGLAGYIMDATEPLPVLILMTYGDEALQERLLEPRLVDSLLRRERARELKLEGLPDSEQLDLILGMLGLDPELARMVRQRTDGNPLFAVQLVDDWVDRGVLEAAEQGFRLRAAEQAAIPDDIHDLWRWRLNRLDSRFGQDAHRSLELAAALGNEVDGTTWRLACELAGHPVPRGLPEKMIELRLALDADDGWIFAHSLLRESLERTAHDAGRWEDHHRTCAEALRTRDQHSPSRRAGEIARHLLAAGNLEEAVPLLLQAAQSHLGLANYARALELYELREATLKRLQVDPGDPRFRESWLLAARVRFKQGSFDAAETLLDRAEAHAAGGRPDPTGAGLLRVRARVLRMRGKLQRALELAERAGDAFRALGDELSASTCDLITARLHFESTGDHRRGLALAGAAVQRFRAAGDEGNLAEAHYISALLHQALGDEAAALTETACARARYREAGNRFGEAVCENFLGEVARQSSAFEQAEAHYRSALRILESIGAKWTYVLRINLTLTLVQSGKYAEAEPLLLALRDEDHEGREAIQCYSDYALMTCAATKQRWSDWDGQYEAAFTVRPETGRVDKDLAELARIAGTLAAEQGMTGRARRALLLSRAHWDALGDLEQVRALDAQLGRLERIE